MESDRVSSFCDDLVNWAGYPLRSLAILPARIRGTTTTTGLSVTARWNRRRYRTKEKVTYEEKLTLRIRHHVISRWNYTISPSTKLQDCSFTNILYRCFIIDNRNPRAASAFFFASRLSKSCFPLHKPKSTFAKPFLKYNRNGTKVNPFS